MGAKPSNCNCGPPPLACHHPSMRARAAAYVRRHVSQSGGNSMVGTARYCSINTHKVPKCCFASSDAPSEVERRTTFVHTRSVTSSCARRLIRWFLLSRIVLCPLSMSFSFAQTGRLLHREGCTGERGIRPDQGINQTRRDDLEAGTCG